jgi:hypothetical protein
MMSRFLAPEYALTLIKPGLQAAEESNRPACLDGLQQCANSTLPGL